jgi:Putative Flp pilus-assembly TadE/G-like
MKQHQSYHTQIKNRRKRNGSVSMIFVVSLFAVIAAVALALDYAWLKTANDELRVAAEAGALAAGRTLANDDLLKPDVSPEKRLIKARLSARQVASENIVAGHRVDLNLDNNEDVRLGRLVNDDETGETKFIETDLLPTSVVVLARRIRARNNPIALFFGGVTSHGVADISSLAEATIDNRIIGVRPFRGVPVPAFPLAISKSNPEGIVGKDCWDDMIQGPSGNDLYGYDPDAALVLRTGDGIPEMTLRYFPKKEDMEKNNVCILDLGNDLSTSLINRQIRSGWKADDLKSYNGELRPGINTESMKGIMKLNGSILTELKRMIGQCRIVLLYNKIEIQDTHGLVQVDCPQLVAIRVLDVLQTQDGVVEILVQPGVMTTRTAILSEKKVATAGLLNDYIYKLHLTH